MRRVLSRDVLVGGETKPEGFPVDQLPPDARASVLHVGWYRVEADPIAEQSDESDGSLTNEQTESQTTQAESNPSQPESQTVTTDANQDTADAKLISESKLDPEIVKLLADAKVLTVGDAKTHLTKNKTFRTIANISKASDAKIREALSL